MYKLITYSFASTLLIVLVVANVIVSGSLSTSGEKLRQIELEQQELLRENQTLQAQILNNTSLTQLANQAEMMGFVKPDSILAIQASNQNVAYNR